MTRRFLLGFLLCGASAAWAAACDGGRWGYDYVYPYGPGRAHVCSQFTSCGSCTPVEGCGWCAFQGGGACVSDPDFCAANLNQFSFTWAPSGCASLGGAATEGGAATSDAAPPTDGATAPRPLDAASSSPPKPGDAGSPKSRDAGATSSPSDASSDADH